MTEPTQAEIDWMIATDARVAAVAEAISVDDAVRSKRGIGIMLELLEQDARASMYEFAICNPGDTRHVQDLQSRVYRYIFTKRTIEAIRERGANAEKTLAEEREFERFDDRAGSSDDPAH